MRNFEYEITAHSTDVMQNLEYFCSPDGECSKEKKPDEKQPTGCCEFLDILNERGRNGWEFVQMFFFKKGITACWKREKQAGDCAQS